MFSSGSPSKLVHSQNSPKFNNQLLHRDLLALACYQPPTTLHFLTGLWAPQKQGHVSFRGHPVLSGKGDTENSLALRKIQPVTMIQLRYGVKAAIDNT